MAVTLKTTKTQSSRIEVSKEDVLAVLTDYLVDKFGVEWKDADVHVDFHEVEDDWGDYKTVFKGINFYITSSTVEVK